MSTIIDSMYLAERAARFAGAAVLVTVMWFAGLAATTLVAEPTRSVVVFGPAGTPLRAVAASPALPVDGGSGYVIARGQRDGFVRELYAAGAWLVLPAMGSGCRRRPA